MTAAISPGGLATAPVPSAADPVTQVLHAALAGCTSGGQQTSSPQKASLVIKRLAQMIEEGETTGSGHGDSESVNKLRKEMQVQMDELKAESHKHGMAIEKMHVAQQDIMSGIGDIRGFMQGLSGQPQLLPLPLPSATPIVVNRRRSTAGNSAGSSNDGHTPAGSQTSQTCGSQAATWGAFVEEEDHEVDYAMHCQFCSDMQLERLKDEMLADWSRHPDTPIPWREYTDKMEKHLTHKKWVERLGAKGVKVSTKASSKADIWKQVVLDENGVVKNKP